MKFEVRKRQIQGFHNAYVLLNEKEGDDNSKLIAAAPEMFEALEKLLNDPECPDHIANYLLPVYLKAKG